MGPTADEDRAAPTENAGTDPAAGPPPKQSLPKRFWAWFNAQGLVARFILGIITAVVTTLAVGFASRAVFDSGGSGPVATTLAADAAPFSVSTDITYGERWLVWLAKPLPDATTWPDSSAKEDDLHRFVNGLGAIDDHTWVRIVLDGTAGRTSTITAARAVVLERRSPTPAAHFIKESEGETKTIGWFFDLDEPGSPAHELTDIAAPPGPLYFTNRTITVAPGEALTLDVITATETCECRWVLELDVVVDGTPRTVRVDNDGEPFETSGGRPDVPVYAWTNPERLWHLPSEPGQEPRTAVAVGLRSRRSLARSLRRSPRRARRSVR